MTPLVAGVLAVAGVVVSPVLDAIVDRATGDESFLAGVGRGSWGAPRSVTELFVPVANGCLWAAAGVRFDEPLVLLVHLAFFSTVLVLSIVDLETSLLPNRITYPALVGSSIAIVAVSLLVADEPARRIGGAAVGAVSWSGFFLALAGLFWLVTKREGIGLGDVKLAALLGLFVGWLDPVLLVPGLFAAGLVGVLTGVVALVVRSGRNEPYPFGPSLVIGAVAVILLSGPLLDALGW